MQRSVKVAGVMVALLVALPMTALAKDKKGEPREVEVIKEGKILVVRGLRGGEPQLTDQEGKRWLIAGALRAEVLRLGGHSLRVWGVVGKKKLMTPTLMVSRYEILESGGGRKPLVGKVVIEDKKTCKLARPEGNLSIKGKKSFIRRLARRAGCKVWIVGDLEGTILKANTFGWISCKPPKAIKPGKESTK